MHKVVLRLPDSWSKWNLEMFVFEERGKPEYPEKNLSAQGREPSTNSTHVWSRSRDSNPGRIGGRWALSSLRHPFLPLLMRSKDLRTSKCMILKVLLCLCSYFVPVHFSQIECAAHSPGNPRIGGIFHQWLEILFFCCSKPYYYYYYYYYCLALCKITGTRVTLAEPIELWTFHNLNVWCNNVSQL